MTDDHLLPEAAAENKPELWAVRCSAK